MSNGLYHEFMKVMPLIENDLLLKLTLFPKAFQRAFNAMDFEAFEFELSKIAHQKSPYSKLDWIDAAALLITKIKLEGQDAAPSSINQAAVRFMEIAIELGADLHFSIRDRNPFLNQHVSLFKSALMQVVSCKEENKPCASPSFPVERLCVFNVLLEHGVYIDGNQNFRPLVFASENGDVEIVDYFLGLGASARLETDDGSALAKAAIGGHSHVIDRLIAHDPDLVKFTPGSSHVLTWAIDGGVDSVKSLLAHGADPNAYPDDPMWLHSVKIYDQLALKALLEHGVDIQVKNKKGNGPLHYWVIANDENQHIQEEDMESVLDLLIEYGADLNVVSNDGKTPLELAQGAQNKNSYPILKKKMAQIEAQTINEVVPAASSRPSKRRI